VYTEIYSFKNILLLKLPETERPSVACFYIIIRGTQTTKQKQSFSGNLEDHDDVPKKIGS